MAAALKGIQPNDEIIVLTWLHRARREVLSVHPGGDRTRELLGYSARAHHTAPTRLGCIASRSPKYPDAACESDTSKRWMGHRSSMSSQCSLVGREAIEATLHAVSQGKPPRVSSRRNGRRLSPTIPFQRNEAVSICCPIYPQWPGVNIFSGSIASSTEAMPR
jgi:hypothetical protein